MKRPMFFIAFVLSSVVITTVFGQEQQAGAPDASAIFEQARIAGERVAFSEGFEGPGETKMVQFYGGDTPNKVVVSGPTNEQARSGKRSYKIAVTFEPVVGKTGAAYFLLPIEIPVWSDLKLKWHVKTTVQPEARISPFHGFTGGNLEAGEGRNVAPYVGRKTGEADGWEIWEATARKTGKVGERIAGAAIYFQIGPIQAPTTVTFYIDDVTISGRLPVNWVEQWAAAARYFREYSEKEKRFSTARRLKAIKEWRAEIRARRQRLGKIPNATPLLARQHAGCLAVLDELVARIDPGVRAIEAVLTNESAPFNANVNEVERRLAEARYYLQAATACHENVDAGIQRDYLTFVVDPTMSYPILPTGPTADRDETSYYAWDQRANSFENPQILPDSQPVPAHTGRKLSNIGCRDTFVPFGFAVHAGRELRDLAFTATDLESARGRIESAQVDLRIVAPWYRPFGGKLRLMNEPLLHDPQFAVPVPGDRRNLFKDPLYGNDADKLLPVTIPAGTNRQFYALVKVPRDAAEDVYRGAIEGTTTDGIRFQLELEVEVLPFDLEPAPYAYSAFYRSYLADEAAKQREGIHSQRKTAAQMEAELRNMAEHGLNTLNLYVGNPRKTDQGWDFTELDRCLAMARRAGLSRSPFTWLGHNIPFIPDGRSLELDTWDELHAAIRERVAAVNDFCRKKNYPRPAFFGHDERSGEELARLKPGYAAVNDAGGIVTVACYFDYWANLGPALTLPIVYGGATSSSARQAIRSSQAAGLQAWIYNCPATNMPASPSVYRRRYGLAIWRNGENGAVPWEYSGVHYTKVGYAFEADTPLYAFAFPTWSGKPIDSIIFEAYREGIYDTRYLATLQKRLAAAKASGSAAPLVQEIEAWLDELSVNDDLPAVRRRMADYITTLGLASGGH